MDFIKMIKEIDEITDGDLEITNEIINKILEKIDFLDRDYLEIKIKICNFLINKFKKINDKEIKRKVLFVLFILFKNQEVIKNFKLNFLVEYIACSDKQSPLFNIKYYDKQSLIYSIYILAYSGNNEYEDIIEHFSYDEDIEIRENAFKAGRKFNKRHKKEKIDIIRELKKEIENREDDLYFFYNTLHYYEFSNSELKEVCNILEININIEIDKDRIDGLLFLINMLSLEKDAIKYINIDFLISKIPSYKHQSIKYILEIIGDTYDNKYLPLLESYSKSEVSDIKKAAIEAIKDTDIITK